MPRTLTDKSAAIKTCRSGRHTYSGNKGCPACSKLNYDRWYSKNRDSVLLYLRTWRSKNRAKFLAAIKLWHEKHSDNILSIARLRAWIQANPGRTAAKVRKYQASKLHATPAWLTSEQLREMQELYSQARKLSQVGEQHHIDHIVPLRGLNVCGLHVPWNLQVLPASKNYAKGNR